MNATRRYHARARTGAKSRTGTSLLLALIFSASLAFAQGPESNSTQEKRMTMHASGPFDVKVIPQTDPELDPALARHNLDKQFHGDLEGTSKGQMLSGSIPAVQSGGYVAIEKITGTLGGRKGSFMLQHNATMTRGTPQMNIIVVPDSGTGELTGLTGQMKIIIAPGGKHSYEFEYTLPGK